ncbi:FAD-dependent oxidoreductase [Halomonas sp. NO4]|uniref:NAD(P)/FAD-dependent oxidoreductase n=1 Tax=Halomonas sp. NO4 TaxID=2484813 RepID=UPI0013CFCDDD|nr:FAD-dependent oxidoreductase [Halomonas sp. NO4]
MNSPGSPPPGRPRILLVGAGHAHLHVIRHRHRLASAELVVVDPGGFWYSGLATGMLGGRVAPAEDRLDPRRLCRRHDATLLRARLDGVDLTTREACLDDGRRLGFSLLSLNLGSQVDHPPARRPGPRVWTVKPIPQLANLRRQLERAFDRGETPRVAVVGGGPSGVEVACNLAALAQRRSGEIEVTLVTRGASVLGEAPPRAQRWLARHLGRLGVRVKTETRAVGHAPGGLMVSDETVPMGEDSLDLVIAEHVVHASGLQPPAVAEALGLPCIEARGLAIHATLQSTGDADIFAVGDCAALPGRALPRQGVYGVRQGPVLLDNLAARLYGRGLRDFVPQRQALAILDLGQGLGLALRGRHWWAGRGALRWKRWLDARFLRRYRG